MKTEMFTYEIWHRLYSCSITAEPGLVREVYFKEGGNTGDIKTIEYKLTK